MAHRTKYEDLPEPQAQPCPVKPEYVNAIRIATLLWQVSEQYHAGAIDYAEYKRRNTALWHEAETSGVAGEVKRQLRKAR